MQSDRIGPQDESREPEYQNTFGFQFAFTVLPTIIYFSAVTSILYHLGIMKKVVEGIAVVMAKTVGTRGAESLACSANILWSTEAPLLIRPFVAKPRIRNSWPLCAAGLPPSPVTIAGMLVDEEVVVARFRL